MYYLLRYIRYILIYSNSLPVISAIEYNNFSLFEKNQHLAPSLRMLSIE